MYIYYLSFIHNVVSIPPISLRGSPRYVTDAMPDSSRTDISGPSHIAGTCSSTSTPTTHVHDHSVAAHSGTDSLSDPPPTTAPSSRAPTLAGIDEKEKHSRSPSPSDIYFFDASYTRTYVVEGRCTSTNSSVTDVNLPSSEEDKLPFVRLLFAHVGYVILCYSLISCVVVVIILIHTPHDAIVRLQRCSHSISRNN